jgi:hypothetical protein
MAGGLRRNVPSGIVIAGAIERKTGNITNLREQQRGAKTESKNEVGGTSCNHHRATV